MSQVIFRKAAAAEMAEIMRFETAVFTGEQGIPSDMIALPPERKPQWWCAADGARVIGTVAAFEENGEVHMGRFAVRPDCRGRRIGPRLVRYAMEDLFSQGVAEFHMEARDVTVKILRALGGEVTGEPFAFYAGMVTPMIMRREHFFGHSGDSDYHSK